MTFQRQSIGFDGILVSDTPGYLPSCHQAHTALQKGCSINLRTDDPGKNRACNALSLHQNEAALFHQHFPSVFQASIRLLLEKRLAFIGHLRNVSMHSNFDLRRLPVFRHQASKNRVDNASLPKLKIRGTSKIPGCFTNRNADTISLESISIAKDSQRQAAVQMASLTSHPCSSSPRTTGFRCASSSELHDDHRSYDLSRHD